MKTASAEGVLRSFAGVGEGKRWNKCEAHDENALSCLRTYGFLLLKRKKKTVLWWRIARGP